MSSPFPFALNEFTTQPWTFEQDLDACAALDIPYLELCEVKLDDPQRQLAALDAHDVQVCSVQPATRTATPSTSQPDPADLGERVERFRRSIETLAPHTPGAVFVTNTGLAQGGDVAGTLDAVVEYHRRLAPVAAEHGVRLALEPLNPVSMNVESCIWTFEQAVDVVRRVDHEAVGVCVDTWNLWQDARLAQALVDHGDLIAILQVSDWRTPRSGMDRRSVGTGDIPTGELLHAVYDAGYRGPCVLEIFSDVPDSLYDTDLHALLRDNRAALDAAWDARA